MAHQHQNQKDVIKAVSVPYVNIILGHRYKLILEYKVPCLQSYAMQDTSFEWYFASSTTTTPVTRNITMPAADFSNSTFIIWTTHLI